MMQIAKSGAKLAGLAEEAGGNRRSVRWRALIRQKAHNTAALKREAQSAQTAPILNECHARRIRPLAAEPRVERRVVQRCIANLEHESLAWIHRRRLGG